MHDEKVEEPTLQVLISIRDEIKLLREDTNRRSEQIDKRFESMDRRFESMDKRFERIEADISEMKNDIKLIVARFDRDYMLPATEVDRMKGRLQVCEQRLGIETEAS